MECSGKPSGSLPTILGHVSAYVFHLCLLCMLPQHKVLHSCKLHMKAILGYLKSPMIHLCGMSGSPRKTYMAQNNMHSSFSPMRNKCFKNAWGKMGLSDPRGKCEHLPQSSQEERDSQVATYLFLT